MKYISSSEIETRWNQ